MDLVYAYSLPLKMCHFDARQFVATFGIVTALLNCFAY
ncbi:hypothetical protein BPUTEOMOX_812 [methanotrophic endosymbiont of Bathymodiolus puteoserpentis (Logatchev)]|nr:hypothetical protein BPUTEOMOX_812 [methanotrophic endosymbiont of Bathymodiolus puteoserpentis (Logatchev)]